MREDHTNGSSVVDREIGGLTVSTGEFKSWRRTLGLTQQQTAEALGRDRRMIGKYERGEVEIPTVVKLAMVGLEAYLAGSAQAENE